MIGSRTIPTLRNAARFRIWVDGVEQPTSLPLLSVHVRLAVNRLSMAKVVLKDLLVQGTRTTPLSNRPEWAPGKSVEIRCGAVDLQTTIFTGVIVRHSVKLRSNTAPELVVECRHALFKATLNRASRVYPESTDSEAIQTLLQAYNLPGMPEVDDTLVRHPELVQYGSTDWDFMLTRAQANGLVVMLQPNGVEIKKPVTIGTPEYTLTAGATIIEMDAEIDARLQPASVEASSWDPASQDIIRQTGNTQVAGGGNLSGDVLADALQHNGNKLWHGAALPGPELKSWADASLQQARLARIRGRIAIEGITDFRLGGLVGLNGISERFDGAGWISGILHTYDNHHGWKTQLQMGGDADTWPEDKPGLHETPAAGLLPAIHGLHIGLVQSVEDPMGEMRVQVTLPAFGNADPVWARMAMPDAGNNRGHFFRPELGDEVLIGFMHADPRYPVVLGCLHSSANASPVSPSDDNHEKGYYSREGVKWVINDDEKSVTIETPGGNKCVLSDDASAISLEDMNGNKIVMDQTGIKLETTATLELAAAQLVLGGSGSVGIKADGNLEIEGGGMGTLKSSGVLTIQGAMVNIN